MSFKDLPEPPPPEPTWFGQFIYRLVKWLDVKLGNCRGGLRAAFLFGGYCNSQDKLLLRGISLLLTTDQSHVVIRAKVLAGNADTYCVSH
jgi:hypothetical protein